MHRKSSPPRLGEGTHPVRDDGASRPTSLHVDTHIKSPSTAQPQTPGAVFQVPPGVGFLYPPPESHAGEALPPLTPQQAHRDPMMGFVQLSPGRTVPSPRRADDALTSLSFSGASPFSNYMMVTPNMGSSAPSASPKDGGRTWFDSGRAHNFTTSVSPFTSSSTLLQPGSGLVIAPAPQQKDLIQRLQLHDYRQHHSPPPHSHRHVAFPTGQGRATQQESGTTADTLRNSFMDSAMQPPPTTPNEKMLQRMGNAHAPHSSTNLFVRHLPLWMDDAGLENLFGRYGFVNSATVMRDIHTAQSLGRGFVRFRDHESAAKAKEMLNNCTIDEGFQEKSASGPGKSLAPLSVQWANAKHDKTGGVDRQRIRKLFVRNIPSSVTKEMLRQLFSPFGKLADVSLHDDTAAAEHTTTPVLSGGPHPESRRIAFITFTTNGVAVEAARHVHNTRPFDTCGDIALMVKLAEDTPTNVKSRLPAPGPLHPSTSTDVGRDKIDVPHGGSGTATAPCSLLGSRNSSFVHVPSPQKAPETAAASPIVRPLASGPGVEALSQSALFAQNLTMTSLSNMMLEPNTMGTFHLASTGYYNTDPRPPGASIVSSQFLSPSSGVLSSANLIPMPPPAQRATPAVMTHANTGIDGSTSNLLAGQPIYLACGTNTYAPSSTRGGTSQRGEVPLQGNRSSASTPVPDSSHHTLPQWENPLPLRSSTSAMDGSLVSSMVGVRPRQSNGNPSSRETSAGVSIVPQYMQRLVPFSIITPEGSLSAVAPDSEETQTPHLPPSHSAATVFGAAPPLPTAPDRGSTLPLPHYSLHLNKSGTSVSSLFFSSTSAATTNTNGITHSRVSGAELDGGLGTPNNYYIPVTLGSFRSPSWAGMGESVPDLSSRSTGAGFFCSPVSQFSKPTTVSSRGTPCSRAGTPPQGRSAFQPPPPSDRPVNAVVKAAPGGLPVFPYQGSGGGFVRQQRAPVLEDWEWSVP